MSRPRPDVRLAGLVVAGLGLLGALLGLVWRFWSGPQQRAFVIAPGKLYPFDEVETMAGADGRYLILTGAVGLLAGLLVWVRARDARGPAAVAALAAGGLLGAALTWWVGYLSGGGTYDGSTGKTIAHLPLTLHMHGLLFAEPVLAVLVYGVFTAFTVRDDLGRPDPVRERRSVQPGEYPQDGGRDSDAAGALQQRDLPA